MATKTWTTPAGELNGIASARDVEAIEARCAASLPQRNGSQRLELLGILLAVIIAVATALVVAANAPARFPGAPYSDLVLRIFGGRCDSATR